LSADSIIPQMIAQVKVVISVINITIRKQNSFQLFSYTPANRCIAAFILSD
jgi:hypothetical protein